MRLKIATAIVFPLGLQSAETTLGDLGSLMLPLTGGTITGVVKFHDSLISATEGGGAIRSVRNIVLASPTASGPNQPFILQNTFSGTNLDPPTSGTPQYATEILNTFNAFNTGQFGARGLGVLTNVGPLSVGASFSGVTSVVTQTSSHPPGTTTWAVNTVFATNAGVTNPNNGLSYYAVIGGTSAPSGTGPSGQGQAIVDGTVTWAYQGPGIPATWAAFTSYPTRGVLVTNPNNGGLFRVETPGISGASPGPVRPRAQLMPARLGSTANIAALIGALTIDGVLSVIGDRVLVKDQSAPAANGVYIVAAGAWTRATDADQWNELVQRYVSIQQGNVNAGTGYLCTITSGGAIGTTPITWALSAAPPPTTAIPDGSVVWSLRSLGANATSFIGLLANSSLSFNCGGTSLDAPIGQQWGAVLGTLVNTNATNIQATVGLEIDDIIRGTVRNSVAQKIVRFGKQAGRQDIALLIQSALGNITPDGTPVRGFKNGVVFSSTIDADYGYAIAFENQGIFAFQHMAGGFDMRLVVPDGAQGQFGGGFYHRWSNGMLDQFGALQMRFSSITPTSTGLTIDVTNQELQSISITDGGANWAVADAWKGSDGSAGSVATVDGSNKILTVNISIPSQAPTGSLPTTVTLSPFNPESIIDALGDDPAPGTVSVTGVPIFPTPATGTPTYAAPATPTINVGTGSAAVINMGRTGQSTNINGIVKLGSDNQIANGSVATVLGSIGPIGSHTTVQEWMAIKNSAGTIRYIPCF